MLEDVRGIGQLAAGHDVADGQDFHQALVRGGSFAAAEVDPAVRFGTYRTGRWQAHDQDGNDDGELAEPFGWSQSGPNCSAYHAHRAGEGTTP